MNQPSRAPDPAGLLRLAFAHHQAGRTEPARAHYQHVLALAPANPDALHLLGLIEIGDGATAAGIARIRAALAEAPTMLTAWANLGTALRRAGQPAEALSCFARVLAAAPADADALAGTGHALRDLGRNGEAVEALSAAAARRPRDGGIRAALALALQAEARHAEAEPAFRAALALRPTDATIPLNLGVTLRALGRDAEVGPCFRHALALRPDYPEALINLGAVALEAKSFLESESLQRRALALRPGSVEAHLGLGNALMARDEPAQAAASYRSAIRLAAAQNDPDRLDARSNLHAALSKLKAWPEMQANAEAIRAAHPDAAFGPFALGDALMGLARFDDAIAAYRAAIALDPLQHAGWEGIGNAHRSLNRIDDAIAAFRQAILIGPENHSAHANLALALLVTGDYAAGLDGYESRWNCDIPLTIRPRPETSVWTGAAPLAGRRLLLQAEQGFGDTLQMLRYVAPVAALAAHVVLEVQPRLKTLLADFPRLAGSPGVELITADDPRPPTDLHVTLMSLPRAFGTRLATIPAAIPYLAAPAPHLRRWAALLPPRPAAGPTIGIAWAGNPQHVNDRNRSIPLALFRRIIAAAPGHVVALQPQRAPGDAALLAAEPNLLDPGAELTDFADTAAAIAHLDLVISVDTAVAHLAGALGRPTWLLLPFSPDWRWLLDRDDTPWYPSMRLFRQPGFADWHSVVDRVAAELAVLGAF